MRLGVQDKARTVLRAFGPCLHIAFSTVDLTPCTVDVPHFRERGASCRKNHGGRHARTMDGETDDIVFEPKVGRSGRDRGASLLKLRTAIRIAGRIGQSRAGKAGGRPATSSQRGPRAHFVKGQAAKPRPAFAGQRRVVVKARFVSHAAGKGAPLRVHVKYLAREGREAALQPSDVKEVEHKPDLGRSVSYLSREGEASSTGLSFYNHRESDLDGKIVTTAWTNDSRHFRLIISAEDGQDLGDLRPFIREVMAGLEAKTGTKLEWIAIDHHDTDNPHTHILVRGRRADGQDLFIPPKLISSGIREHAQEIVTRVLGPRQEVDLVRERSRDIEALGPSAIDKELLRSRNRLGLIQVNRPDLIARLERLEGWALATREPNGWRMEPDVTARLKVMATHAEVENVVAWSAFGKGLERAREAEHAIATTGELVHFGPLDDLGETFLAIVENEHGELRYSTLDRADDLAQLDGVPVGATVAFKPREIDVRPSDHAVAAVASRTGGVYSIAHHASSAPGASEELMEANVRRLEAMRRAGLVERGSDGVFQIAGDHLERALDFERKLAAHSPLTVQVNSHLPLKEQVKAVGPTRLDRILSGADKPQAGKGRVAAAEAAALQQRRMFLIEQGILGGTDEKLGGRAIAAMARNELAEAAHRASGELGVPVITQARTSIEGVYVRRIDLAQGRMAIIMQERQAFMVPWRPALERFAGREVRGALRANGLSWSLNIKRGQPLPPM